MNMFFIQGRDFIYTRIRIERQWLMQTKLLKNFDGMTQRADTRLTNTP